MRSAGDILHENQITLRSYREGNQKCLCPRCSHTRKNKKDPCLSVLIDDQGVQWFCHNCQFHGGEFYDGKARNQPPPPVNRRAQDRRARSLYR